MKCSMNHVRQLSSSQGSIQNAINMFVHKSKKEVIIVSNIAVDMDHSSDLKCNQLLFFDDVKFLKITSVNHHIIIIMMQQGI